MCIAFAYLASFALELHTPVRVDVVVIVNR